MYEPVYTCKAVAVRSLWQTVRRGPGIDEWVVRYQHFGHLSEICRICSALETSNLAFSILRSSSRQSAGHVRADMSEAALVKRKREERGKRVGTRARARDTEPKTPEHCGTRGYVARPNRGKEISRQFFFLAPPLLSRLATAD